MQMPIYIGQQSYRRCNMEKYEMKLTITKAKYFKNSDGKNVSVNVTMDGQDMSVPMDTDNTDYQAILEWVAEGNKIEDAD